MPTAPQKWIPETAIRVRENKSETVAQVYGFMALSAVYESVAAPHN
jgi:hypothetical protein